MSELSSEYRVRIFEGIACRHKVNCEALKDFFEAGSRELLPKDLVAILQEFRVTRYQIDWRLARINKRLEKEFRETAEKRGGIGL